MGDIEEIGNDGYGGDDNSDGDAGVGSSRTCVKCPWHSYLIDLETGKKWYKGLEPGPDGKLVPAGWKSSDASVQRIHKIRDCDAGLYIQLQLEGKSSSDRWAHRDDIGEQLGAVLVGCKEK